MNIQSFTFDLSPFELFFLKKTPLMNFQQDSAISSIQERIQRLETIVSGGSHGYYDEEIGNTSLMDELKEAQNKLNLLKREDATIESFFDLYHQVESLLFTNSKHSDGSVEPSLYEVDLDAKHEIVVSATQDLTNISKCLKQIDELKHELDSNLLNGLFQFVPFFNRLTLKMLLL